MRVLVTTCLLAIASGLGCAAGPAAMAAPAACPAVDSTTGAVSPAPAPDVDWQGCNLASANLANADLTGANLTGANLTGANLTDANFTGADLYGSYLTSTVLSGTNFSSANLYGAGTYLATFSDLVWSDTTCPNGSDSTSVADQGSCYGGLEPLPVTAPVVSGSIGANGWYTSPVTVTWNWYITEQGASNLALCAVTSQSSGDGPAVVVEAGCMGEAGSSTLTFKIDTTVPRVAVTGIAAGHVYALGRIPKARCTTSDAVSGVAAPAVLQASAVPATPGSYPAVCAGAVSRAGTAASRVSVTYQAAYGLAGFLAPKQKASVVPGRSLKVRFRLAGLNGKPLAGQAAARLARSGGIAVGLTGGGLRASANCAWVVKRSYFECAIGLPRHLKIGHSHPYTITVTERLGRQRVLSPAMPHVANAERIYFR
jgi:hypothetical protein